MTTDIIARARKLARLRRKFGEDREESIINDVCDLAEKLEATLSETRKDKDIAKAAAKAHQSANIERMKRISDGYWQDQAAKFQKDLEEAIKALRVWAECTSALDPDEQVVEIAPALLGGILTVPYAAFKDALRCVQKWDMSETSEIAGIFDIQTIPKTK